MWNWCQILSIRSTDVLHEIWLMDVWWWSGKCVSICANSLKLKFVEANAFYAFIKLGPTIACMAITSTVDPAKKNKYAKIRSFWGKFLLKVYGRKIEQWSIKRPSFHTCKLRTNVHKFNWINHFISTERANRSAIIKFNSTLSPSHSLSLLICNIFISFQLIKKQFNVSRRLVGPFHRQMSGIYLVKIWILHNKIVCCHGFHTWLWFCLSFSLYLNGIFIMLRIKW